MDVKLGVRLLVKHPGLTFVGGVAIAFAIAVGAASFEFVKQVVFPTIPLHDGDRIVSIRLWHAAANGVEEQALFDFARWRGTLQSIDHLGAFRTVERNLITGDAAGDPIVTAEITASAFPLAGVPALLGRTLIDADERSGAPAVVVLGYDVWQSRFHGDPATIGRAVQIGDTTHVVVGVMPEGFAFPKFHSLWIPLRVDDLPSGPRQGPWIDVFGRLAPGVTLAAAQAEMTTVGQRTAAAFPATHQHIRPEALPYARSITPLLQEMPPAALLSINLFFVMLLALVAANVALLMFARAAARHTELALRAALGASRRRIVGQLFVEALVLGGVAAIVGLVAAQFTLAWWLQVAREEDGGLLAFWHRDTLSSTTMLYAVLLTIVGAAIAGLGSGLKATGRGLDLLLRQSSGAGGLRFGGVWTAVIVTQVAVTVTFPATTLLVRRGVVHVRSVDAGIAESEYLTARLEMAPVFVGSADGVARAEFPASRFRATAEELARRLAEEPAIAAVAFADPLPRMHHRPRRFEIDADDAALRERAARERGAVITVSPNYFDAVGAPVVAGRGFTGADLQGQARVGVVNESFAQHVLGLPNPIGHRVRELPDRGEGGPGPWIEIVGVVKNLGVLGPERGAGLYRPVAPGDDGSRHLLLHVRGDPAATAGHLRQIAAAVDPTLHLRQVVPLGDVGRTQWLEFNFLFKLLLVVSGIALLLSLSSIYAALSFVVARRTREIGIRVALGADRLLITWTILRRSVIHIAIGVAIGSALTVPLPGLLEVPPLGVGAVPLYALAMFGLCLLAIIVPMRRALRVQPAEALRTDA
jgi:predicted permease